MPSFSSSRLMTMNLNNQQIRELKRLAHHLKPVVMVGQQGLGENVLNEIDIALDAHELIKIKLAGADKVERDQISREIIARHKASLIQLIGRVAIFTAPTRTKRKTGLSSERYPGS